jgi:hypothetical protein
MIFFERIFLTRAMTFKAGSIVRDDPVQGILGNPGGPRAGNEEEQSKDKQNKQSKHERIFHGDYLPCTTSLNRMVTKYFPSRQLPCRRK